MIKVTPLGAPAHFLLPYAPNWRAGLETRLAIPAQAERGLTGREARRPFGSALRTELAMECWLDRDQAAAFRNAMQDVAFAGAPLWFPFWPAVRPLGETGPWLFTSGKWLILDLPSGLAELHDSPSPTGPYPVTALAVPALCGRLADPPRPEALTDEFLKVHLRLKDGQDPSVALQAASTAFALGPATAGRSHPLFPLRPEFGDSPETGAAETEVEWQEIGFGREEASALFPQSPARPVAFSVHAGSLSEAARLVRFFEDRRALAESFWLPTALAESRLRADVAPTDSALAVDAGESAFGHNRFLAFLDPWKSVTRTVTGFREVSGQPVLDLDSAVGAAFSARETALWTLALARFSNRHLTIRWGSPEQSETRIECVEVPAEYYTPVGETHGATIGPLPVRAYLYRFRVTYPGETAEWRFTSFERDLTDTASGSFLYEARPIQHGDIRESLNLEKNEVTLKARAFPGNPLQLLVPPRLEFPLEVEIFEVETVPGGPDVQNARRLFKGEVSTVETDGPFLTARASNLGNLFERKLPRWLLQPTCNWALFDDACGLSRSAWKFRGLVAAYLASPPSLILKSLTRVEGAPLTPPAHWFAHGWVEIGSGQAFLARYLCDSSAYSTAGEGSITLNLASALPAAPALNSEVFLFPGCDGRRESCASKFANYSRFGGFPFIPVGNPSMVKMPSNRKMK